MKQNYKHLTREERYSIEQMRKAGYKQKEIAILLNRSESTISREIGRNTGGRGYRHKQADEFANQRRFESRKRKRFTPEVQEAVEYYLREDYSPEQVTGFMRRQGEATVSHERIYQHIYSVDSKRYYGDWEGDLIVGSKHEGAVLTLVERKTKHCLMYPLEGKRSDEVMLAMIVALKPFVGKLRSITLDNGKEFSGHETVSAVLGVPIYFAHPYSSWERGLNENTNGLIRQYLRKGESLKGLTLEQCRIIEEKLNDRPRKTLGFVAPIELYHKLIDTQV